MKKSGPPCQPLFSPRRPRRLRRRNHGLRCAAGWIERRLYKRLCYNFRHMDTDSFMKPAFDRYIGIDYSGAKTPASSLPGLRVYMADQASQPLEVQPPPSPRKYWTRRGIAEWMVERLSEERPTLAGIDHGFSFPLQYFESHCLPHDWPFFLDDFHCHWPTDGDHTYVDFVRNGNVGNGAARTGNPRWRRLTEVRAKAKSVFHFDVQGSVGEVHPRRASLAALYSP